jgi:hypothetical protein
MDRQIAFVLAGATLALGFGGYLMTANMGEYDLDKSAKNDAARLERLDESANGKKGPGLFAALLDKAAVKMETARNVYLGEHFPEIPDGWFLRKTHHDEIVDFTVDYGLELDITDKSSMRRLAGWGAQSLVRTTDLAYRKDDKVIFMRLTFANKKLKKPLSSVHSWLFNGNFSKGEDIILAGAIFKQRQVQGTDIINLAAETGYYTGIGILSNASLAEVETLLNGMDMFTFASLSGNPEGGSVVPFLKTKEPGLQAMNTIDADVIESERTNMVKAAPKASPKGNLLDGLDASEDEEVVEQAEEKPKKKRKNLLSSLLSGDDDEGISIKIRKRQKKSEKTGGSFQKVGNFTSRCQSGGGAKICRVDE